jgi:hypothetical protein
MLGARLGPEAYWRDPHRVRPKLGACVGTCAFRIYGVITRPEDADNQL